MFTVGGCGGEGDGRAEIAGGGWLGEVGDDDPPRQPAASTATHAANDTRRTSTKMPVFEVIAITMSRPRPPFRASLRENSAESTSHVIKRYGG
jgi:hypothetical protein